ncbi:YihY/virulence factor BrkB family protein [Roseovarius sp.]|uniref:YihY/virulence factor BrkB family protein n=1 Tax=Roseovarius sp. TaxID=1486281 RepID=UPI00260A276C|nr:YihY/virulence factor BrkB family protein [Roseovarius sp.]MDM8167660.1 YihY/virulence factor BrkB family protein [Roseovarius sp.]
MQAKPRGQAATHPVEIPRRGWWDIVRRLVWGIPADHLSVVAAGVAFFGLLAIFPAVVALISIAGVLLDPVDVASQLEAYIGMLPQEAAAIIQDQVLKVTGGDEAATGFAAILGLLLAIYGATRGMMTLMEGMNIAYGESETRGFVALYATGVALTLVIIVGLLTALVFMIVLPAVVGFLGLPGKVETAIVWLQWPVLALLAVLGLAVLYRFGPARAKARWRWISPGAVVATFLWMLGTIGFSLYTQNFASYNETYGTLGGVIILLTWLWLSSFIVLAGAKLNAEIEHQTRRDTTTGPPRPEGERGAIKADTYPDGLTAPEEGPGRGLRKPDI